MNLDVKPKSSHAEREEKIMAFWKEKGIFDKSLNKWPDGKAPKGEFVFYEGPPTANGHPHIGHFEDGLLRMRSLVTKPCKDSTFAVKAVGTHTDCL